MPDVNVSDSPNVPVGESTERPIKRYGRSGPGRPPKYPKSPDQPAPYETAPIEIQQRPQSIEAEPSDQPDRPIIDESLMKDFLGPGSGVEFLGEPTDNPPDEVVDFLSIHEFGKRRFDIILKEAEGDNTVVKSWFRKIPSIEYIARNYGPGKYNLLILWFESEDGKKRRRAETVPLTISEKFGHEYAEHMRNRKVESMKENQKRIQELRFDREIDQAITSATAPSPQSPKEYIKEIRDTAEMLGLIPKHAATGGSDSIMPQIMAALPTIGAAVGALLKIFTERQAASADMMNRMLMLMMDRSDKANMQMLEVMKMSQGVGSGSNSMKEIRDMVFGMLDIKEALTGDKQSIADRVFSAVENVLPELLKVMSLSAAQRQNDFRYQMAQQYVSKDPTFQTAMHDPAILQTLITKWDDFYGWEQTDGILQIAGIQRPENCPRDPQKRFSPEQKAADVTVEDQAPDAAG